MVLSSRRKTIPRRRTIFVLPGTGGVVFSHDRMAQKNPTIASSAVTNVIRSTVAAVPPPDVVYMYRSSLGVIAFCLSVGGSTFR